MLRCLQRNNRVDCDWAVTEHVLNLILDYLITELEGTLYNVMLCFAVLVHETYLPHCRAVTSHTVELLLPPSL